MQRSHLQSFLAIIIIGGKYDKNNSQPEYKTKDGQNRSFNAEVPLQ